MRQAEDIVDELRTLALAVNQAGVIIAQSECPI